MNTQMTIRQVTEATGLGRADIYRAQEMAGLGAPGHFGYRGSEQVFTAEGAALLAEGLDEIGRPTEARALRAALDMRRAKAPAGRDWLGNWEAAQERGAA